MVAAANQMGISVLSDDTDVFGQFALKNINIINGKVSMKLLVKLLIYKKT